MPRPIHNASSYLPGLDGIRALAVTLVLLYHLSVPGFSGGLMGVGVFFTLSGYLITSLLISSHEKHGNLGLNTFWIRRFRRLMPAVILMLIATLGTAAIVVPQKLGEYSWEALTALFYVNNWYMIGTDQSYFGRFEGPSPLSHMWSLSIEEQFYIVWPLLLALMFLILRRRMLITGFIVLLSIGSFWLLSEVAVAGFDNTRAYEGTDTRAGGLLLGAALAFWWPARKHKVSENSRAFIDALGLAGIAGIVYLSMSMPGTSPDLYTWGLLALTFATMAVLVAAVTPATLAAKLLSVQPMRWIGERSYGIYLWHMPLVAFLPATLRSESKLASAAIVVVGTLLLATLSWRYVEDPIRRYGFKKAFTTPRPAEEKLLAQLIAALASLFAAITSGLNRLLAKVQGGDTSTAPASEPAVEAPAAEPAPVEVETEPVPTATAWDAATPSSLEPAPLVEEAVNVTWPPVEEQEVDLTPPPDESDVDAPDTETSAEQPVHTPPSEAPTRSFAAITVPVDAQEAGATDESPADVEEKPEPVEQPVTLAYSAVPDTEPTAEPSAVEPVTSAVDLPPALEPADSAPEAEAESARRSPARAVLTMVVVIGVALATMVGVARLNPNLPVISALAGDTSGLDDSGIEDIDEGPEPAVVGPLLPESQRRTSCTTLIHVGDSTSIGMNAAELQPNAALRLSGRYASVGVKKYISDVVGGRSSIEEVDGEPNAHDSILADIQRGASGCWVMAMGINDTANMEVGGPGPLDMRIDRLLEPLKGEPVLWPTVITNSLNQNPAYNNRAMQRFNRALVRACKRYPNLRVYDWADEAKQEWFKDGVHYTDAGYIERARRFAVAVATMFPKDDVPPAGCVLKSTSAVEKKPV